MFTVMTQYIRDGAAKLSGNKRTQAGAVDARCEWEVGALASTAGRMLQRCFLQLSCYCFMPLGFFITHLLQSDGKNFKPHFATNSAPLGY